MDFAFKPFNRSAPAANRRRIFVNDEGQKTEEMQESTAAAEAGEAAPSELDDLPGVWRELGDLPPGAIITEQGLARVFRRSQATIKRAVRRGELPPSTRLLGVPAWTVGAILRHIEVRLEAEQRDAKRTKRRITELSP